MTRVLDIDVLTEHNVNRSLVATSAVRVPMDSLDFTANDVSAFIFR